MTDNTSTKTELLNDCPCGSQQNFERCCKPFIDEIESPPTALALMRSRYTAYTRADVNYLEKTCIQSKGLSFDPDELSAWASQVTWRGLEILDIEQGEENDDLGIVEFVARYVENGREENIHERSEFKKIDGQWFYIYGSNVPILNTKISRNAPCPCGSGKKYKKCCYL